MSLARPVVTAVSQSGQLGPYLLAAVVQRQETVAAERSESIDRVPWKQSTPSNLALPS